MIARKKKATLKKAAMESEIISGAWGERERDLSNESDGAGGSRQEGRDGGGGEC